MEILQTFLNILLPPLTLLGACLIVPPYWVFKMASFIVRSMYPEDVRGKVVLITGASSGIGEQVAYAYAKRGARVALVARRRDRLLDVAEKARELGSPDALVITADISKHENCEQIVRDTVAHFGRVDHLVNNAAMARTKFVEEHTDIQEMKSIMDTNFWGAVSITRSAMAHLRKSKGRIVVVSSAVTWIPFPRLGVYSGSKAALTALFETLRVEARGDVKLTLVIPEIVESEMTTISKHRQSLATQPPSDEFWGKFIKKTRFPVEKPQVCAEAILRSVCRGDRDLIEPKWAIALYCVLYWCPELVDFIQHYLMIDFCKKYM